MCSAREPVEQKTPLDFLLEKESPATVEKETAVAVAAAILALLIPKNLGDRVIEEKPLESIGRRAVALLILIRAEDENCQELAKLYGGHRASFSWAVKQLSLVTGIPAPDRAEAACEKYSQRANEVWSKKKDPAPSEGISLHT